MDARLGGCLRCVRCACTCQGQPQEQWCEAQVLSVLPGAVLTSRGRFALSQGHTPRPGQTILVPCGGKGGYSLGETPQIRRRRSRGDEELLAISIPEYDTPQRPGLWN